MDPIDRWFAETAAYARFLGRLQAFWRVVLFLVGLGLGLAIRGCGG